MTGKRVSSKGTKMSPCACQVGEAQSDPWRTQGWLLGTVCPLVSHQLHAFGVICILPQKSPMGFFLPLNCFSKASQEANSFHRTPSSFRAKFPPPDTLHCAEPSLSV